MDNIQLPIKIFSHAEDLPLPRYMTSGSVGMDMFAAISDPLIIDCGDYWPIPTGIAFSLPEGYEAMIRPRSGLAFKHGVTILNAPGTIDSDYRGEVRVLLINHGKLPFQVNRGDRIAQLVINRIVQAKWMRRQELDATVRGRGGFGHTGVST
ncbi:MAG: deoxyuridine 5'-triphosphate nucleotidohydrolase [Candidatus Cloacimonetes bacterium 4572_55]|nr:MAG: deoxyuridine 5'-triphosphate nucleotidohydrolase [Candidatus Cloacimonetes bacterium 4572_55]